MFMQEKKLVSGVLLALALAVSPTLLACSTATVDQSATSEQATSQAADIKVSMTIDGTVGGGTSETVDVEVPAGATVYDALVLAGVDHEMTDSSYGPYVSAINGIGAAASSGWTFTVNGEMPDVGASEVVLAEGDAIVWTYVNF